METSIRTLHLPCKLVLNDYKGFLANAESQGEDNLIMAKMIADLGFIRVFGVGYHADGVTPLLYTGLEYKGQDVGLAESELKYFTPHSAGF